MTKNAKTKNTKIAKMTKRIVDRAYVCARGVGRGGQLPAMDDEQLPRAGWRGRAGGQIPIS